MCVSWCQSVGEVWSVSGGSWVSRGREAPWGICFFCFCCYWSWLSCPFPLTVEFVLRNCRSIQKDCSCTSDLVARSHDCVVALKWVWSSAPLSAGSWGPERVLVLQICVERTCDVQNRKSISAVTAASTEWNLAGMCSSLMISGSFPGTSQCSAVEGLYGWICLSWVGYNPSLGVLLQKSGPFGNFQQMLQAFWCLLCCVLP